MNERLDSLLQRYKELSLLIEDPELVRDQRKYRDTMREYSQLGEIATARGKIEDFSRQLEETRALIQSEEDQEMRELAREEGRELEQQIRDAEDRLKFLL
ncbi:MAG: PCRF domain-containing protein, partial [Spirochaetaceae bacterium]|nr:PCRF domain-containing protein [Spirochaetaceae bacterium]